MGRSLGHCVGGLGVPRVTLDRDGIAASEPSRELRTFAVFFAFCADWLRPAGGLVRDATDDDTSMPSTAGSISTATIVFSMGCPRLATARWPNALTPTSAPTFSESRSSPWPNVWAITTGCAGGGAKDSRIRCERAAVAAAAVAAAVVAEADAIAETGAGAAADAPR